MEQPTVIQHGDMEIKAIECKLTVEGDEGTGGDWERNVGGMTKRRRVTFEGWATPALYDAIVDAIGRVIE